MKTRKLLAVVLAVAMLVSLFSVPAFAADEGTVVGNLGIFVGDGDGVTATYLAKETTKLQGAMIVLRLLGLEDEALAFTGTATFTDAALATAYWQPVLAYFKANPALGFQGPGDGTFGVADMLTAKMLNKVLLVALGYEEGVDFTWATVDTFAASVGLTALADMDELTNEDVAVAIVEALGLETVGGLTLISQLVDMGVVLEKDAVTAGFTVEHAAFAISDAYASGRKIITAKLNMALPEDAVVTLKKGSVGLNTTMTTSDDKMTLTFTGYFNYSAGTYTLTVDDATFTFTIAAEKAVDLVIAADYVYIGAGQDLKVSLLNQYGEKMSLSGATVSVVPSAGTVSAIEKTTTVKVNTSAVEAGKTLFVFVYDPTSMLSAQGTVAVNTNPVIKGITFGEVTIKDAKASIVEGTSGHIIEVNAVDQYGNPYTFAEGALPAAITLISSNTDVISPAAVTVNADGNFVFATPNDGTAILTAIVPTEGVVAQSAPIVVIATAVLSSVSVEGAEGALYVNETGTLVAAGTDQYGAAATIVGGASGVTFQSTKPGIVPTVVDGKIKVTPTESGTAKVFYYFKGNLVGSFDLTVYAEAVPTLITAVDLTNAVQTGVTVSVTSGSATVVDQYGRAIDLDGDWNIELTYADADNFDVVTSASMTYAITANATVGTDAFKICLTDDGVVDEGSVYSFTLANVAAAKIVTIEMELPDLMYGGTPTDGSTLANYSEDIVFVGKTEGGDTVTLLDSNDDGVPNIVDIVTISSSAVIELTGATLSNKGTIGDDDSTLTVKAWRNGVVADTGTITIASDAAVASSLAWIKDQDMSNPDTITVVVKNQYGVVCNLPAGQWYSSNTAVWAFEGTTSANKTPNYTFVNTSTTDDKTVTISYITTDGKLFITGSFTVAKNTAAGSGNPAGH